MAIDLTNLEKTLNERFAADILGFSNFRNQLTVRVKAAAIMPIMRFLRDDASAGFDILSDVTVVDGLKLPEDMEFPERFAVVYHLTSLKEFTRIRVKTFVSEDAPEIDSVGSLWASALWGEREAHDMFGVSFKGNPDLRRMLMPEDFEGFPLRKDYPLKGRGERDNFPKYTEIPEN